MPADLAHQVCRGEGLVYDPDLRVKKSAGGVVAMTLNDTERILHRKPLGCIGAGQSALKRQADFPTQFQESPRSKAPPHAGAPPRTLLTSQSPPFGVALESREWQLRPLSEGVGAVSGLALVGMA